MKTEQIAERKPLPDDEIRLAKECCLVMGECAATYHIIIGLEEIERLKALLSAAEAERDRLREVVSLMHNAMADKSGAWIRARIWLDAHDIYHGDLQENAVLAEVCRAALDAGKEQPHD